MSQFELSSRSANLYRAEVAVRQLGAVAVPQFVEINSSYFDSLEQPKGELFEGQGDGGFEKPAQGVIDHYLHQLHLQSKFVMIDKVLEKVTAEGPVIVRCDPDIPVGVEYLSFAGTYPSFIAKPIANTQDGVHKAVASVIAGKHTAYADYYHGRHNISERNLGVMVMKLIDSPAIHGTVYSYHGDVRSEHVYDPSLDAGQYASQYGATHYIRDRFGVNDGVHEDRLCQDINFADRLIELCSVLESEFRYPIDVEYLVDSSGVIHVVQVRPISRPHIINWERYYKQDRSQVVVSEEIERRAIINSVGLLDISQGDLLTGLEYTKGLNSGADIIIDHSETKKFLGEMHRQKQHNALRLFIRHGSNRVRDHFQYSIFEDPSIDFLAHITNEEAVMVSEGGSFYSNGDRVTVV